MSERKPIRISVGFSDKQSENYNSTAYSVNLEMDVHVNGSSHEVEEASEKLFRLCKKIVNNQKQPSSLPSHQADPLFSEPEHPHLIHSHAEKPASPKQKKFILSLAKKQKMNDLDVKNLPMKYDNASSFNELSSKQASELIEYLSGKKAA